MTLKEFTDSINKQFFSSGIYPDYCYFKLSFYKDFAFIATYENELDGGENVLKEFVEFVSTKRNTFVINCIHLFSRIETVSSARFFQELLSKYLSQEEFVN